jgi:hypothetical protein
MPNELGPSASTELPADQTGARTGEFDDPCICGDSWAAMTSGTVIWRRSGSGFRHSCARRPERSCSPDNLPGFARAGPGITMLSRAFGRSAPRRCLENRCASSRVEPGAPYQRRRPRQSGVRVPRRFPTVQTAHSPDNPALPEHPFQRLHGEFQLLASGKRKAVLAGGVAASGNPYNDPPTGQYVVASITVTYEGAREGMPGAALQAVYLGSDNVLHADSQCGQVVPQESMDLPPLNNGGTTSYQACMDVPPNAIPGGRFFVEPTGANGDDRPTGTSSNATRLSLPDQNQLWRTSFSTVLPPGNTACFGAKLRRKTRPVCHDAERFTSIVVPQRGRRQHDKIGQCGSRRFGRVEVPTEHCPGDTSAAVRTHAHACVQVGCDGLRQR